MKLFRNFIFYILIINFTALLDFFIRHFINFCTLIYYNYKVNIFQC